MNKLITARTCPYGLKCWAYADMLGSDIDKVNVQGDELKSYQRDVSMKGKIPFLQREDCDLYGSNDICAWLLLEYGNSETVYDITAEQSNFDKYKHLDEHFSCINSSFYKWAMSGFSCVENFESLNSAIDLIKDKTSFQGERHKIDFAGANLAGFLCRFITYEEPFQTFLSAHGLSEWFKHIDDTLNLKKGEYSEFGMYFNRFVGAKQ